MFQLFWDLHQQNRLNETAQQLESASARTQDLHTEIARLNARVDRLSLACQAMWELARERLQLTDEQVFEQMEKIDLRDGSKDGSIGPNAKACPACSRMSYAGRGACVYCGAALKKNHAFQV